MPLPIVIAALLADGTLREESSDAPTLGRCFVAGTIPNGPRIYVQAAADRDWYTVAPGAGPSAPRVATGDLTIALDVWNRYWTAADDAALAADGR